MEHMELLKSIERKAYEELREINEKGNLRTDRKAVGELLDIVKDSAEICEKEERKYSHAGGNAGGGYSSSGWVADGRVEYGRESGGSYNGYSERRDSMGRYTRGGEDMREHMEKLMHMTRDPEEKEMLRRMISRMG